MRSEREAQEQRIGIPWTPLSHLIGMRSQRERATLFLTSLACALTRERPTLPRPFGARRYRSCPKQLQAFAVFQRERATILHSLGLQSRI